MNRADRAVVAYLTALELVESRGFTHEIDTEKRRRLELLTPQIFLSETAWVILSSGMSESTIRRVFPRVRDSFEQFESPSTIAGAPRRFVRRCRRWFNHPAKLLGIIEAAGWVARQGVQAIRDGLQTQGPTSLQHIPFVGPVTARHLAKNLGLDVAKPDRHLVRAASALGFRDVDHLCETVASRTGDSLGVVDLVFWRFATLDRDYEVFLRRVQ